MERDRDKETKSLGVSEMAGFSEEGKRLGEAARQKHRERKKDQEGEVQRRGHSDTDRSRDSTKSGTDRNG